MNPNVTVVILAAGQGTRMKSSRAKVLHEAGGDTLLNNVIRAALKLVAPENIVVVIGHQAEQVRASVPFSGVRFACQPEQKGTGHAVLCAREAVQSSSGSLMILNGDGPLLKPSTLQRLLEQSALAPGGAILTMELDDPFGYGRIIRDHDGMVAAIVEQKCASEQQQKIREVNPGAYCFNAEFFWQYLPEIKPDNPAAEHYLTDVVSILARRHRPVAPVPVPDPTELLGINTRIELAVADRILRTRKANELMLAGVTIENPETVSIDLDVEVGQDSTIEPGVQLRGKTRIGENCRIGAGSVLRDCEVGAHTAILPYVVAEACSVGSRSAVGPFTRLRNGAQTAEDTHIGNFVELKNTQFGKGSKANHLAYLGDSVIGARVNIGAGTITCNYDGEQKHRTTIGDGVFVGSNSTLVAPVTIADGAYVAAASAITKNVEADALAIGRAYQVDKPGWAKRRREMKKKKS